MSFCRLKWISRNFSSQHCRQFFYRFDLMSPCSYGVLWWFIFLRLLYGFVFVSSSEFFLGQPWHLSYEDSCPRFSFSPGFLPFLYFLRLSKFSCFSLVSLYSCFLYYICQFESSFNVCLILVWLALVHLSWLLTCLISPGNYIMSCLSQLSQPVCQAKLLGLCKFAGPLDLLLASFY